MVWAKNGTTTLTVAGDNIEVTGMTENKFLVVLTHILPITNSVDYKWTVNNDTGSNYARRRSLDGGADGTDVSQSNIFPLGIGNGKPAFGVNYICNIATEEKLSIEFTVDQQTAGAANTPRRGEHVAKWVNTSDYITTYDQTNVNSGDYDTDSNVSVIGSDGTEELNVQDGAIYYDTDLNKEYVLYNNTWTEV
jgi:hypothetical protein